ncbi:cytochrome c oxidase subunit II [Neomegalonema sp.]|uniref:cytochrome c oxidase subunit II n=1 Tax=Neomegalonema sp. TaxID=2039713 RepID=UPI00262EB5C8|nr:cytochrome c oxidase subunit II [Neomegalonema sp.]MDD2869012.1 cytochrome c oxidase subunit II [Neomegalonema sp.]
MRSSAKPAAMIIAAGLTLAAGAAAAQDALGHAVNWQTGFQAATTEVADRTHGVHSVLLVIITIITLFVVALLGYTCFRFSAKNNPEPRRFTHNTLVEVVWTIVPVIILAVIAGPSIRLLYFQEEIPPADITIKGVGHQWNWEYTYPLADDQEINFTSIMLEKDEAEAEDLPWLLATSDPLVVPVGKVVRLQLTASTVIHAWTVPSFGVKMDAVPGRLNETWFRPDVVGTFYGQCSELCGKDHSFMPIMVKVVPQEEYDAWVAENLAALDGGDQPTRLAEAR